MNAVEFVEKFGWEEAAFALKSPSGLDCYADIENDIRDLVDSWELVESLGGLENAKKVLKQIKARDHKYAQNFERPALERAISDVESVGGGV